MMLPVHPVENLGITLQLPPTSISMFPHLQVQPTIDCLVPQYIFSGKKFMCKWTLVVQIPGIQESNVVTIFFFLVARTFTLFSSVQFSHSVVSDSLRPHESQHARPPCPTPRVHPNSCASSWQCHPDISSSVIPFSSCPQSLPATGSFPMSQLFASGGQSIGFSLSISPSNEHPGLISFRMDWLDLLAVQGTLKSLLQHHSSKASILRHSAFFTAQLSHLYTTTGKTIALTRRTFVGKVMSLLFNMLSRLVLSFLPRSKRLLISWLQSPSAVILEPKKIKSDTVSSVSPSLCHEVMGPDAMIFVFWMWSFKPTFSLSSFIFIKRLFSSSSLSAIRVVSSAYLRFLINAYFLSILRRILEIRTTEPLSRKIPRNYREQKLKQNEQCFSWWSNAM